MNLADWYGAFEVSLEDDYDADKAEEGAPEDSRSSKRHKGPAKRSSSRRSGKSRSDEPNGYSNGNAEANDGMDTEESEDEDLARMRTHQARFLASAADLAYLGFIQPTKRKAEHVARIVF